jgi:hypothetical protein
MAKTNDPRVNKIQYTLFIIYNCEISAKFIYAPHFPDRVTGQPPPSIHKNSRNCYAQQNRLFTLSIKPMNNELCFLFLYSIPSIFTPLVFYFYSVGDLTASIYIITFPTRLSTSTRSLIEHLMGAVYNLFGKPPVSNRLDIGKQQKNVKYI